MLDRRTLRSLVAAAAAVLATTLTLPADALVIARVTRHGYILVDEPGAAIPWGNAIPTASTGDMLSFLADATTAIDQAGAPHGDYLAAMQTSYDRTSFAFYFGLINDTRGLGITSPLGDHRETYDLNAMVGTAYPLTGFVFLNDVVIYAGPGADGFTRRLVCAQEFGHHYGSFLRVPSAPGADAGADAQVDGGTDDGSTPADAEADATDGSAPVPLPPDILLGRQRAHWSYFMNTGGSPMEGNAWSEPSPGTFVSGNPSLQFSPLDFYVMGLIPPSEVPPFFVIAEPDVGALTDPSGAAITRESPPEYSRRVTIHGRRVTWTIDDVIRANGPRVPAYQPPDAGADAGPAARPDLDVVWVLLANAAQVNDALAEEFDQGIEGCTAAYGDAAGGRSHLNTTVLDAGPADGSVDAAGDAAADGGPSDARSADVDASPLAPTPRGGCGCSTGSRDEGHSELLIAGAALFAATLATRRRRRGQRANRRDTSAGGRC